MHRNKKITRELIRKKKKVKLPKNSSKIIAKFSMEEEERLIDFVKSHEQIYNVKLMDYKNHAIKIHLWQ